MKLSSPCSPMMPQYTTPSFTSHLWPFWWTSSHPLNCLLTLPSQTLPLSRLLKRQRSRKHNIAPVLKKLHFQRGKDTDFQLCRISPAIYPSYTANQVQSLGHDCSSLNTPWMKWLKEYMRRWLVIIPGERAKEQRWDHTVDLRTKCNPVWVKGL